MPDWQLTPEEEVYGDTAYDENGAAPMVDENGMPIGTPPPDSGYPQQQPMVDENGMPIGTPPPDSGSPQQQPMVRPDGTGDPSQQELDQAFPPQQRPSNQYPPRQPPPQRQ